MSNLSPACTVGDTSRLSLLLICSFRLLSSSWAALSCSLVLWYWEICVSSCFLTSISCIYDAKEHQREMNETKYQTGENKREQKKCGPYVLIACQQVLLFHLILESLLELSDLSLLLLNLSSQPLSGLCLRAL